MINNPIKSIESHPKSYFMVADICLQQNLVKDQATDSTQFFVKLISEP